jgi:acetaldehyde dehydrogenase/alcohol dehydrogenase
VQNHFASEEIYNRYKNEKTVGIVSDDPLTGIQQIAEPMGVLCGIVPTTNPTSTAIFKCLLALKTRNGIVLAPHPRASACTIAAAKVVRDAAVAAGAPENIISFIENPTKEETFELMKKSDMIIATGGPAMVRSSYSSGTPAIGVGAGNTPALIDDDADISMAVNYILLSKTFDLGVICASEQAVVVLSGVAEEFLSEIQHRGAVVLEPDDVERVRLGLFTDGRINPDTVGRTPYDLARMFGLENEHITESTRLLLTPVQSVGPSEVLSSEKLCPILAYYCAETFEDALETANELVENGGAGHTSVIYSSNVDHIKRWESTIQTVRLLVNMPSSQGAIGDIFNNLDPSLTLGCGSFGHTSVSNNVQAKHLLNFKTVANRRENMMWFRVPPRIYFKEGALNVALRELAGRKRAFIVTDRPVLDMGFVDEVQNVLDEIGCQSQVFYHGMDRRAFSRLFCSSQLNLIDIALPTPSLPRQFTPIRILNQSALEQRSFRSTAPMSSLPWEAVLPWMLLRSCGCCTPTQTLASKASLLGSWTYENESTRSPRILRTKHYSSAFRRRAVPGRR